MKRRRFAVVTLLGMLFIVGTFAANTVVERKYNRVRSQPPYTVPADAAQIHRRLFIADLHADSLLWGRNLLRRSTVGHIDIPRLEQANVSLQVFTVVTTIPRNLNINRNSSSSDLVRYMAIVQGWPPQTWNSPKDRALYQASRLAKAESDAGGQIVILRTRSELQQFAASPHAQKIAVLLGAEGAQPLEGDLRNLDDLYAAGFRMMSPTHFTDTEIAGSASGERRGGLTALGRNWVRAMEAKSMLIDLAHASPATIRDVTSMASRPVIVSHTGVRGTCDNNRNLSDEELRAVARTGGLIGIGYWEAAVCGRDARAIARAIQYTAGIVGIDHVALGSDYDGATTMPFDVTGIPLVTDALIRAGFPEKAIDQIMGDNVVRLLSATLPK